MKIALFSDVHSNLPALEAFFQDVEKYRPDAMYCLGDLVGYNIWPNEVINAIRRRSIPCIAGNYDWGIGRNSNDCGCAYKSDQEKSNGAVSIRVTNNLIGEEERQYLKNLPSHIRLTFELSDGDFFDLLLVHGSPRKINEYLFEDRPEKSMLRILVEANADVLCFGHTHKPYHRKLQDVDKTRHAINLGSIGKPKDGDARGSYVLLELKPDHHEANERVKVAFQRFEYDVQRAVKAVEESELPNEYATALRLGK